MADFWLIEDSYVVATAVARVRVRRKFLSSGWLLRVLKQIFTMKEVTW